MPDFSQASQSLKDKLPPFPQYTIPTESTCDWIIENGIATSTRGLGVVTDPGEGNPVGHAYRASVNAGHTGPVTFGIKGWGGIVVIGGQYYQWSGRSVVSSDGKGGYLPLRIQFLGLTDDAEIGLSWGGPWGYSEYVAAFNIGLRGPANSFVVLANEPCGKIILDTFWFTAASATQGYHSGLHINNWEELVLRRHRWRGRKPTDPGIKFMEHVFYLKSSRGNTWIIENELKGANGTGFQIRPGPDEATATNAPIGPVVIAYNFADGYGFTHGDTAATEQGGSCISVWSSPTAPVIVYRNRITDARYGCLMIGGQSLSPFVTGLDRNWYGPHGYPIQYAIVEDNVFSNPRAQRSTASVSNVHVVDWNVNNQFLPGSKGLTFTSGWSYQNAVPTKPSARLNGTVNLVGGIPQGIPIRTAKKDGTIEEVPIPDAMLTSWLQR